MMTKLETISNNHISLECICGHGSMISVAELLTKLRPDMTIHQVAGNAQASTARLFGISDISGSIGDDIIDLTSPDYSLAAHTMLISGGDGDDVIWGSDAGESIGGNSGNDVLFGGAGTNTLTGGAGADEFQFTKTSTADTIKDFNITEGDTLVFFNTGGADFDRDSIAINSLGDELSIAYGPNAEDVLTISFENAVLQLDDLTADVLSIA